MEYRTIQLTNELPDETVRTFVGELLGQSHYDNCIEDSALVLKPNGDPLFKLVRNALPAPLCKETWLNFRQVAVMPIIGGSRGKAAGAMLQPARKRDGSPGRMSGVPDVPRLRDSSNAIVGFFDRTVRQPYCRQTTFGPNHRLVRPCLPFIHAVDTVFREHMPDRYAAQMKWIGATAPEFVIRGTSFTTVTINKNFRTAAHTDQGDLPEGFGVLTSLCAGEFSGGELIFPRFRVAVQFRSRDVLLADVHELHGNAPIEGISGKYERVSCVFYYRENMIECGSPADELAFAKSRKAGDPLFPNHRSHALRMSLPTDSNDGSERKNDQEPIPPVGDVATPGLLANAQITVLTSLPAFANGFQLRVAALEDREKLEAFCKRPTCPKIGKEFPFIWRRNGNWGTERNRPTIAVMDHQIIGFHATSYTKGGYCNLYYVVVDTEVKRMGLGKTLIENSLKRGHALGMTRWTNKSHKGSDGENFFSKHLGILPIAEKGTEVIYDWSIKGVNTIEDLRTILGDKLRTTATDLYSLHEIPERKLNAYAKANVESGLIMLLEVPNLPAYVPKSTPSSGNVSADVGLDKPEERKAAVANSLDPSIENDVLGSGVSPRKSKRNVLNGTGTVNAPSEPALSYEGMTQQKTILFMIAPGASGKTTLRRQFTSQDAGAERFHFSKQCYFSSRYTCCGENFRKKEELEIHLAGGEPSSHKPEKGCYDAYKVGYTFFSNGTAICGLTGKNGHPGTGADANGNLDANMVAIDHALMHRDFVIFDGVITSERLFFHLQNHPYPNLKLVFVHLNFSEEIVRARLAKRRADNKKSGKGAAKEPDAWLTTISGAKRRWIQAKSIVTRPNVQWIEISDPTLTPEQLKNQIEEETRNHDYNIPTVSFACLRTGNPFASFTK